MYPNISGPAAQALWGPELVTEACPSSPCSRRGREGAQAPPWLQGDAGQVSEHLSHDFHLQMVTALITWVGLQKGQVGGMVRAEDAAQGEPVPTVLGAVAAGGLACTVTSNRPPPPSNLYDSCCACRTGFGHTHAPTLGRPPGHAGPWPLTGEPGPLVVTPSVPAAHPILGRLWKPQDRGSAAQPRGRTPRAHRLPPTTVLP